MGTLLAITLGLLAICQGYLAYALMAQRDRIRQLDATVRTIILNRMHETHERVRRSL